MKWEGHNNVGNIFSEMKDFDQAIHAALDFAERDGNTLVEEFFSLEERI